MNFCDWLKKQKDRDDFIGDLSGDFIRSGDKCPGNTQGEWVVYLESRGACDGAFDALNAAFEEFNERT